MNRMISYTDLMAVFKRKFAGYDQYQCECAMLDCRDTLQRLGETPDSEYGRKLWCEIDAIRDRQMQIARNVRELKAMVAQ